MFYLISGLNTYSSIPEYLENTERRKISYDDFIGFMQDTCWIGKHRNNRKLLDDLDSWFFIDKFGFQIIEK